MNNAFYDKIMQLCIKDHSDRIVHKKTNKDFRSKDHKKCEKCGGWLMAMKQFGIVKWYDGKLGYLFKEHVCDE